MSSQKGNVKKSRQQKHQNSSSFINTKYEASGKIKELYSMQIVGVCQHCKEKIEWKIKYKKYKALTAPRRCNKCGEKTVKRAYYILCMPCSTQDEVCAMCTKHEPIVNQPGLNSQEDTRKSQLENELKYMSERERRTFLRKNLTQLSAQREERKKICDGASEEDSDDNDLSDEFDLDILNKENLINNVTDTLSSLSTNTS